MGQAALLLSPCFLCDVSKDPWLAKIKQLNSDGGVGKVCQTDSENVGFVHLSFVWVSTQAQPFFPKSI